MLVCAQNCHIFQQVANQAVVSAEVEKFLNEVSSILIGTDLSQVLINGSDYLSNILVVEEFEGFLERESASLAQNKRSNILLQTGKTFFPLLKA